ncbi:hypothetical protein NDU88_001415 [Pleurodeles waltl]|uniref:Uncharacterized protein n=1 Tax=Pleurodeles waltl TaxID=8319 RepID=A0AAV7WI95_PLEWA|nr:hypothetical protein NDU88_001415 [Pleurodeles waltl]
MARCPGNPDADRKYPKGTLENAETDPEVLGAATIRRKNAEAKGVLKPEQSDCEREEFSLRGEDGTVTSRPEQMSERRRRQGAIPSNPRVQPEEGTREERCGKQTGHALGRAKPRQLQSQNKVESGENGN